MSLQEFDQKFPLQDIVVPPDRQRKVFAKIEELAGSIKRNGLINPVIVRRPGNFLVAGERRFTAYNYLHKQWAEANKDQAPEFSPWFNIPFRYLDTLDDNMVQAIELEENTQREQITWQERAEALLKIQELREKSLEGSTMARTAASLGLSEDTLSRWLLVGRAIRSGNKVVIGATSFTEAVNKVKRELTAQLNDDANRLMATPKAVVVAAVKPSGSDVVKEVTLAPRPVDNQPIINTDFIEWASKYTGEPFSFIHCDFPYGINHQKSQQGNVGDYGAYDDSEDVYWKLCEALADNKKRLFHNSAHIMFWFSMKHYVKTLEFFQKAFPEFVIEDYPLVWTKRQGIAPDVTRRPQRNYETALFGFSMGRPLAALCSNVIAAAPGQKLHASQKAPRALRHLFRLCVNNETSMLDPTCGSGTSLQAAKALGARRVVGIEKDPKFAKLANDDYAMAASMNFMVGLDETED